jgi:hypothetical protein
MLQQLMLVRDERDQQLKGSFAVFERQLSTTTADRVCVCVFVTADLNRKLKRRPLVRSLFVVPFFMERRKANYLFE